MKRRCYYCGEVFGEKEPLSNPEETSGECDLCHWLFTLWYALHLEGATSETASEFILDCRRAFEVPSDHKVLECELTEPPTFDSLPGGVEPLTPRNHPDQESIPVSGLSELRAG